MLSKQDKQLSVPLENVDHILLNLRKERTYSFIQIVKGEYKTWNIYLVIGKCIIRLHVNT